MKNELEIFEYKRNAIIKAVDTLHAAVLMEAGNDDIRQHNFFVNREHFEDSIYFAFCHNIDNRYHQKAARKFIDKLFDYA